MDNIDEMKEQWTLLQNKLNQQQIINQQLLSRTVTSNVNKLSNFMWIMAIVALFVSIPCIWLLVYSYGFFKDVAIFLTIGMVLEVVLHVYNTLILPKASDASIDPVAFQDKMMKFRKVYIANIYFGLILLLVCIVWSLIKGFEMSYLVVAGAIGGVIGLIIGMLLNNRVLNNVRAIREDAQTMKSWKENQ
ncbi:MAG: hypothetical protein PHD07_04120 [Bacteroidales bacterium]|nr:hypothetical protein [Bacteroidales bacterium]MDD3200536.1 hypothetical protein [Bacteroidales bacterium]